MARRQSAFLDGVGSVVDVGGTTYKRRPLRNVKPAAPSRDRSAIYRDWRAATSRALAQAQREQSRAVREYNRAIREYNKAIQERRKLAKEHTAQAVRDFNKRQREFSQRQRELMKMVAEELDRRATLSRAELQELAAQLVDVLDLEGDGDRTERRTDE